MIHPNGTAAPNGTASIYGLFWQLRGGQCNVHRDFGFQEGQQDPQLQQSIACNLLLEGGNVTKVHTAAYWFLPFSCLSAGAYHFSCKTVKVVERSIGQSLLLMRLPNVLLCTT